MEKAFDFLRAALPWIAAGLLVGLAVGTCIKKGARSEDDDEKK